MLAGTSKGRLTYFVVAVVILVVVIGGWAGSSWSPKGQIARTDVSVSAVRRASGRRVAIVSGKVIAEVPRLISAAVAGRAEQVSAEVGQHVKKGELLLQLTNPSVLDAQLTASAQLAAGRLDAERAAADIRVLVLSKQGEVSDAKAQAAIAQLQAEAERRLADAGVVSSLQARKSELLAENLRQRVGEAEQALKIITSLLESVRKAGESQIESLLANERLKKFEVEALQLIAPMAGIIQELPVTEGQEVSAGAVLVRMYDPESLSVELQVPERQANAVKKGFAVNLQIAGRNLRGQVSRVFPTVKDGSVVVSVAVQMADMTDARPELRVEAEIFDPSSAGMLVVQAPPNSIPNSVASVFVISGEVAERREVRFGSVVGGLAEVEAGLLEGETIIVSGLDGIQGYDVLRVN